VPLCPSAQGPRLEFDKLGITKRLGPALELQTWLERRAPVDRLVENAWACVRSVMSAAVRSAAAALMSAAAQLFAAASIDRLAGLLVLAALMSETRAPTLGIRPR
jgi:hypothetical protein